MKLKRAAGFVVLAIAFSLGGFEARAVLAPELDVLRVGDGSGAPGSGSTSLFIDTYLGAVQIGSVAIPTDGTGLTLSGTTVSEGALTLSPDGTMLTFAGYAVASGTSDISGSSAGSANRAVGFLDGNGSFSTTATKSSLAFSGDSVRSAVTDGLNYWLSGTSSGSGSPNGGVWYSAAGGAPSQIQAGDFRNVNIFNGALYYSTGSGTPGIYGYGGMPTTGSTASLVFGTGASSSPNDFAFNPTGSFAYVADNTAGLERWDLNAGNWTLSYTLNSPGSIRQIAVDFSGANPIVYAIAGEGTGNQIVTWEDTGSGSIYDTLATAPTNTVFRGLDFVPTPEPSTFALVGLGWAAWCGLRRRRS